MSVIIQGDQLRQIALGQGPVSKASGASPTTVAAFTVTGGEVLITALWLKVTTSITTDSGTVAVNLVPTTGDTQTLVTATDLGTTDTTAGTTVGLDSGTTAASKFLRGGRVNLNAIATTGTINIIGAASVNGAFTINVCWIPLTAGAVLVAA